MVRRNSFAVNRSQRSPDRSLGAFAFSRTYWSRGLADDSDFDDCSTQGAFYLPNPNDAEPQPEAVSEPSDIAQQPSSPASSPQPPPVQLKNVSQRNECPSLTETNGPCIQGMPGSEQKGGWTIYKVDITNSCECTCAVDGTDSRGQGRGVIVEAYSKDKITCIRTPQGGCTGFKDDLSYNCPR